VYKAKHIKSEAKNRKAIVLFLALLLIMSVSFSGTLAYIVDSTGRIENTFIPAEVECEVHEVFANNVKSDVTVKNTGNTGAYIRAAVVVNWVDDANTHALGKLPERDVDYKIAYNLHTNGWLQHTDGYYYHVQPVSAGETTSVLIEHCYPVADKAPNGYRLSVEIIAQAIQSEPTHVVADVWKVPMNGIYINPSVIGVSDDDENV